MILNSILKSVRVVFRILRHTHTHTHGHAYNNKVVKYLLRKTVLYEKMDYTFLFRNYLERMLHGNV